MTHLVDQLQARVAALEEELADWRERAAVHDAEERIRRLQSAFPIPRSTAIVLQALYDARRPLEARTLLAMIPALDHTRERSKANVAVRVAALRKILGEKAIESVDAGYVLTDRGRREVEGSAFILPLQGAA